MHVHLKHSIETYTTFLSISCFHMNMHMIMSVYMWLVGMSHKNILAILRPCLVGLLALAFGPKSQKLNQRGCFWRVLFQKQLLFRSSFLKAGLTLLLAFGFLLFEIGGIKSSSIVVSREIKIKGIFYTCLTKQLSAFLQLTAHSSFFPQPQLNQTGPKDLTRLFSWLGWSSENVKL